LFETLVADLATRLAASAADRIDGTIDDTLRQLAATLRLDWVHLWPAADGPRRFGGYRMSLGTLPTHPELEGLLANPVVTARIRARSPVWLTSSRGAVGPDVSLSTLRAAAVVPVIQSGEGGGRWVLVFGSARDEHSWSLAERELLRILAAAVGQALARKAEAAALCRLRTELDALRARPAGEPTSPRPASAVLSASGLVASEGPAIQHALAQLEQVAQTSSTVLLLGETGVGKERFAQAIHELSARRGRQMVRVSCAAIPVALIESELFGRERGAYTGALTRQVGRFESASGSTLFLDEIGELSADVQAKLLRVLEERVIERLGSSTSIDIDVRIIAATNRNLEKAVAEGAFREDLFYRLNVFPIAIPPLRDRVEDIPGLAWKFVDEFSQSIGRSIHSISVESMRQLKAYAWPGNIRELRNVIERAVIVCKGPVLTVNVPQPGPARPTASTTALKDVEAAHIRSVLESCGWRIRGASGAAERLGLKPSTLETRMARLGLKRPR
jgi:transcriptional regulator with GAF, ATPase, and Fis domain